MRYRYYLCTYICTLQKRQLAAQSGSFNLSDSVFCDLFPDVAEVWTFFSYFEIPSHFYGLNLKKKMFLFLIACHVDDMHLQCMLWRKKNRTIDDNLNMEV